MGKLLFALFLLMIVVIYVDNHNQQQKQDFYQSIQKCKKQAESKPNKDIICLADGLPCHLQKDYTSVEGMICLAENYRIGRNLWFHQEKFGKDLYQSAYWYEQLAKKGHPEAQFKMAQIYENGIGITKDLKNANAWYYQAYKSGHLEAGFVLANHLTQGKGIEKDYQNALHLYHQLAELHYKPAIFKMGEIYDNGLLGVQENNQIALAYFNKIPNYQGVSGINGKLEHLNMEISLTQSIQAQSLIEQYPQTQYIKPNQKNYSSQYYGHGQQPTAQCWDGTYSYSLGRRGVCSSHGGVRYWLSE